MPSAIEDRWVTILKALAHKTRLKIVMELLGETRCVTAIHELLPASQANISQHLTILRHAGLVDFSQEGAQRCYFLAQPQLISDLVKLLEEAPRDDQQHNPTCGSAEQ